MTARQRRFAVFAAVNVLLLLVGWFALLSPQRHDAASAAAQAQLVENQLAALTGASSQGPVKQPAIHTADIYALDTALPAQVDLPDLLFEVDRLAEASDVDVESITPMPPQAVASNYTVQPLNLSLSGSYFHLTHFLRTLRLLVSEHQGRLTADGPLFAVTSVALNPGEAADGAKGHVEAATVSMAAYYYGVVGGASPPADTSTTNTTTTSGG